MSAVEEVAQPSVARRPRVAAWAVYRVELKKLRSQILARIALGVCLLGPFVFIAIMKTQTTLPDDSLYGRWLHTSGFALPMVMLTFAGEVGFLVLIAVVAGDIFSSEDRYGTWDTVLIRPCRRGDVFVGKTLAAATYALAVLVLLTVSSIVSGLLLVGSQPMVDLSGRLVDGGSWLGLVLESWATTIPPVLAFTCLGVLLSIATRSSIMGVLGTIVVGLLMELLAVLGFRTLLLTTPFEAWHALLISPSDAWPFVQGTLVSIGYAAACLGGGWWLLRRRDFAGSAPASRQANQNLRVRVGVVSVAAVVVLGAASFRPSPVTSASLQKSVTATFLNLAQHKREMIGRPVAINGHVLPAGTSLRLTTTCTRGGQVGPGKGPGDDWTCLMALPGTLQPLFGYEVNAKANGCYTADGSTAIMGPLMIRVGNKTVVNPLFEFDGCIDTP